MSNDIQALRSHLFNTLQALQDKDNPMDIERAKAVCQVSDTIISSAKAEIDFARVNGSVDTQFFHKPLAELPQQTQSQPRLGVTIEGNVTTHKMQG